MTPELTPGQRRRVEELFHQAIAQPPERRAEFLNGACPDDPTVRHEVEELLRHHDADTTYTRAPAPSDPVSSREPPDLSPGQRVGPYKVLQLIGSGRFGDVYMAEQEERVRRRVALKIIKLGMDTHRVIARFEAERHALALMDHPNVARVLDAGATDSGRPYFVMELVKGVRITQYCDENRLAIGERLELFTQVCDAVQHAHQKGVIHRDIKPSNVLVSTVEGRPLAKVIDFGIAKATDHRLTEKTLFTEFHEMIGTPQYMSPEQASGSPDIDTRTDIYSLGALLYELLTGTPPFDPKLLRSAAYTEIQRIIREVEPPTPSTRLSRSADTVPKLATARRIEPHKFGQLVRGELDWIVMKCLEKNRKRRYETASALALDIQHHLGGEPVVAAPPSKAYRVRKFARRHRTGLLTVAMALTFVVAATVGITVALLRAIEAEKRLTREATRATAAADFLANLLASPDPDEGHRQVRVAEGECYS